ncbi:hypothetical protein BpHYR1_019569 [Brachionus plicatilis]|uniref:Uncharacterized protein n=1 Tax=Brachionus plicatilis TaxID=10195 RepID=A0A3M7Q3E9_BRAPC|nr:hypothetical protein BpHYR1_019569 [Brachionus plicatilis]
MALAPCTSSDSHLDLAAISHSTSALGQWATAFCSKASSQPQVPLGWIHTQGVRINSSGTFKGTLLSAILSIVSPRVNLVLLVNADSDHIANDSLARLDIVGLFAVDRIGKPLVAVDVDPVGLQRLDSSVNDLVHHVHIAIGLLQLGGHDPNLPIISSLASASHRSTDCEQHSTARLSMILASSSSSSSMAAFHSFTELGIFSSALRNTFFFAFSSLSSSAALIHSLTELGSCLTAWATMPLDMSSGRSRAASSHTSSLLGHCSVPFMARLRAACILPTTSSSLAEAIHAGGWLGLVSRTDLSSSRAFLMSFMSPP